MAVSGAGLDDSAAAMAERVRRSNAKVFAAYLAFQAVVGIGFWVALATSPGIRELFELRPALPAVTDAFVLADLLVGVAGSALGAWALWSDARWAVPVIAATSGGLVYPTLFLLLWVVMEGTGAACLAIMVPPSTISTYVTWWVWKSPRPPT
jgi:hypothetical protein